MNIKVVERPAEVQVTYLEKASATVLEEGQMCVLDAGKLAVEAGSDPAACAYVAATAKAGETKVAVLNSPLVRFSGKADTNFAKTMRGKEVALVVTVGVHMVDPGTAGNGTLKIASDEAAGTVGSDKDVNFYIKNTL